MKIFYRNYVFEVFPQVYLPAEDSFLLAESLAVKGGRTLDIGTGCGIQAIVVTERASKVLACDISMEAVKCAGYNACLNKANIEVFQSDLFESVSGKFDLIVFNPPYLPSDPSDTDDELRKSWDGGKNGREVIDRFIDDAAKFLKPEGRVQLVASSLGNVGHVMQKFKEACLRPEITARKKYFFEELCVVNASYNKFY